MVASVVAEAAVAAVKAAEASGEVVMAVVAA